MKTTIIIALFSVLAVAQGWAQSENTTRIPLLGELTPEFSAQTTMGKVKFPEDYPMKWKIIFSHPADFTPVCSSELLHLAAMQEDFDKLNTRILVLSTDGLSSHLAWIQSLETISYPGKETVKIGFPLIADPDMSISRKFGMIHSYTSNTRDVRGVFIIDPNDRISAVLFYPMNIGRNMDEVKRILIALQTADKYDVLTPANWNPGDPVMITAPETQQEAEQMASKKNPKLTSLAWYMWFKTL